MPGNKQKPDDARIEAPMFTLSQRFRDPMLEALYRVDMRSQTRYGVQLGLVLAALLFLLFGALDVLFNVRALPVTLAVRAVVIAAALAVLAMLSFYRMRRYQEAILLGFCVVMTVGLGVIVSVVETAVADRYYVGFVLVIIASYLIIGISFISGTVVAALNILAWLLITLALRGPVDIGTHTEFAFLFSATAIAGIAARSLGRQRRLAYYRRKLLQQEMVTTQHSALHDPLTGLPNRRLFMEKLSQAVARDIRFGKYCAVLFMDLDGFKLVNDHYGHATGDALLLAVAERLSHAVRETDTVARFGGDEFVVLLEDLDDVANVDIATQRINEALSIPVELDGVKIDVVTSIGLALHPVNADSPEELLRVADTSMYVHKKARKAARAMTEANESPSPR